MAMDSDYGIYKEAINRVKIRDGMVTDVCNRLTKVFKPYRNRLTVL